MNEFGLYLLAAESVSLLLILYLACHDIISGAGVLLLPVMICLAGPVFSYFAGFSVLTEVIVCSGSGVLFGIYYMLAVYLALFRGNMYSVMHNRHH